MGKIWQKDYNLDELIEIFTVGRDYQLDHHLLVADSLAGAAHASMLHSIDILSTPELESLKKGFTSIIRQARAQTFSIKREDEDGHTAIENYLVKEIGEAGKKIHTGRSRNDQVLTALRLYMKDYLFSLIFTGLDTAEALLEFAHIYQYIPMPGRTHMQTAMPSSVGLWAGSFAEELLDDLEQLKSVFNLFDQCPLGAAASYGVPLPLNRRMVSEMLGFAKVQNNVLYVNNSRGKFEAILLDVLDQVVLTLSKIAQDLILFSLPEFGYFSLPNELCSGSSIMPQKKNPDALELIRSKAALLSGYSVQVKGIIRSLPSGYNRDFQDTKEPMMRGTEIALLSLKVMEKCILTLKVNQDQLIKGFTPDIFATDAALEKVQTGASFRDAYQEVGLNLTALRERDPYAAVKARTSIGTAGNLCLEQSIETITSLRQEFKEKEGSFLKSMKALLDISARPFSGIV